MEEKKVFGYVIISVFALLISCIVIAGIVNTYFPAPDYNTINCTPEITYIYSLETGSGIEGSFFLGIGSVRDKMYYYFYRDSDYKGYTLDKIEIQEYYFTVSLVEDDSLRPQLRKYGGQFCKDNLQGDYRFELIVPTNTIKKSYNGMVNQ